MDVEIFDSDALPIPDLGLHCHQCGYPLAGLTSHCCPECGWQFKMDDLVPPGDFPTLIYAGKEILLTPTVIELLRRARIPFMESIGTTENLYGIAGATNRRARAG